MCKRYIDWLPHAYPQLVTWPRTQACALTGNRTGDFLVHRPVLNPLSHTNQGSSEPLKSLNLSNPTPTVQIGQLTTREEPDLPQVTQETQGLTSQCQPPPLAGLARLPHT